MKRFLLLFSIVCMLAVPAAAEPIKWVDFDVPYESMKYAMNVDIQTFEQENHIDWIDILAIAACRVMSRRQRQMCIRDRPTALCWAVFLAATPSRRMGSGCRSTD